MYEAPGSGVTAILIDGEVIREGKQPVLFAGKDMVDVCPFFNDLLPVSTALYAFLRIRTGTFI